MAAKPLECQPMSQDAGQVAVGPGWFTASAHRYDWFSLLGATEGIILLT